MGIGNHFNNRYIFGTDSLRYTSALSVALAVVFVVITAGVAIVRLIQGTVEIPKLFPEVDGISSIWKLFTAVPVLVTAYICHYNGASPTDYWTPDFIVSNFLWYQICISSCLYSSQHRQWARGQDSNQTNCANFTGTLLKCIHCNKLLCISPLWWGYPGWCARQFWLRPSHSI